MTKLGLTYREAYQLEMHGMVDRGASRKLSLEERMNYKGPVFYIPHTEVLNPNSVSTPLRIVFNSSAKYCGFNLNDMWAKGPDMLNSLYGILLRFREYPVAFTCDLSKMFNQVALSIFDQHCHRILWRDFEINREPDHYVLTSASFGDKCAGIIAMLALKFTAEKYIETFPVAANLIVNNSYVDDIIGGAQNSLDAIKVMEDIDYIVAKGGFKVKHFVTSAKDARHPGVNMVDLEQEKVLGVKWLLHLDFLSFKVKINFSPKFRKVNRGPDLNAENLLENIPSVVTKRMIFSVTAAQYDPLGLINPVMLKGKLLMRKLSRQNSLTQSDWDTPLSPELRQEWVEYFRCLFDLEKVKFKRCINPTNSVGNPILIVFSDASFMAYGACAYVRYQLRDGSYISNLLTAKGRLAPIDQITMPRLELLGALTSARLRDTIICEMTVQFDRVVHIVDSDIVRSQIQKESYGFGTFTATKIAEIQSKSNPDEWYWIAGDLNPADMITRPANPKDLNEDSMWQRGPQFLALPLEEWPIKKDLVMDLPDRLKVYSATAMLKGPSLTEIIQLDRFSCYYKLIKSYVQGSKYI